MPRGQICNQYYVILELKPGATQNQFRGHKWSPGHTLDTPGLDSKDARSGLKAFKSNSSVMTTRTFQYQKTSLFK